MIIRGSIDNFQVSGSNVTLGGWVFIQNGDEKSNVKDLYIDGVQITSLNFHNRTDFAQDTAFGFKMVFSGKANLYAIFLGLFKVFAQADQVKTELKFWSNLNNKIIALMLQDYYVNSGLNNDFLMAEAALDSIRSSFVSNKNHDSTHASILIDVGFKTYDNKVSVGYDGYLFLNGGSNSLVSLYENKSCKSGEAWVDLINDRINFFRKSKIEYMQLIIPEKQSVMPELFYGDLVVPTTSLRHINNSLADNLNYLNLFDLLRTSYLNEGLVSYRRVDSHLSYQGARLISEALFKHFSTNSLSLSRPVLIENFIGGDLGNKFGFGNLLESVLIPDLSKWDFGKINPKLIFSSNNERNTGSIYEWLNEDFRIDKTVLIFGNSVFERGTDCFGLSWWVSKIFKRTVFQWSSSLDDTMIEKYQPDIVICQTVERFLQTIPTH